MPFVGGREKMGLRGEMRIVWDWLRLEVWDSWSWIPWKSFSLLV